MFKSIFVVGRIHVHKVMKELRQLCKTALYRLENVKINENNKQNFDQNKYAYACETTSDTESNDDNN